MKGVDDWDAVSARDSVEITMGVKMPSTRGRTGRQDSEVFDVKVAIIGGGTVRPFLRSRTGKARYQPGNIPQKRIYRGSIQPYFGPSGNSAQANKGCNKIH